MLEILVASNNSHKIDEFKSYFSKYQVKVYSLKDLNIDIDVDETGLTFKENAFLKADALRKLTDKVIISDDSGLEIKSLDNFPGIYSSRFMFNSPYSEKFIKINEMLGEFKSRECRFNSTLCVINLLKEPIYFVGYAYGEILKEPRGNSSFGYDPIFYSIEAKKSFAELDIEEKNKVSHRGKAIKKLIEFMEDNDLLYEI